MLSLLLLLFHVWQTQNTVYEIVSDMSSRQDAVEERLTNLEDKIQTLQVSTSNQFGQFNMNAKYEIHLMKTVQMHSI